MEINFDSPDWQKLEPMLRKIWPEEVFDASLAAALRTLEKGAAAHWQKIMTLPQSTWSTVANAYSKAGSDPQGLDKDECLLSAELLADARSEYYQGDADPTLAAAAKSLISSFVALGTPDADTPWREEDRRPQDVPPASLPPGDGKPPAPQASPVPAKPPADRARDLMKDVSGGAYWDKGHVDHLAVRAEVASLMSAAYPEPQEEHSHE